MAQFADHTDLATRLGLTLSASDQTRADALFVIVSGMIQEESKQKIELVTDDVWNTPGTPDEMIKLPEHPVVSVSSVTLDGQPLVEGSDWYFEDDAIRRIPAVTQVLTGGLIDEAFTFPLGTGFGWPAQTLAITYTHGYDANNIPQTVKAICLEAVIRAWVNPGSVARQSVGDTMTVYDNMRFSPQGLMLTDDEKKTIRRVFGRTAKSIQMGL